MPVQENTLLQMETKFQESRSVHNITLWRIKYSFPHLVYFENTLMPPTQKKHVWIYEAAHRLSLVVMKDVGEE